MINAAEFALGRLQRAYTRTTWSALRRTDVLWPATAPLRLTVDGSVRRRANLLVPELDVAVHFGGYIALWNLARRLAEDGLAVRVIALRRPPRPRSSWQEQVEQFDGLDGLFDHVEIEFAEDRVRPLVVSPTDGFVAFNWSTAHVAHHAAKTLGSEGFVYLIHDYEPSCFPAGSVAAMAREALEFPHFAMFSSDLLSGYYARNRTGVFASGEEEEGFSVRSYSRMLSPRCAGRVPSISMGVDRDR